MKQTAWIIGASTGLGRQLSEQLAAAGADVIISSRNQRDLDALSKHIELKYGTSARTLLLDLDDVKDASAGKLVVDTVVLNQNFPDFCYMMAGSINEQDEALTAIQTLKNSLQQNFTGPMLLINELLSRKQDKPIQIIIASSVAAIRARGKNIAYGASKKALEHYCLGLMHALAGSTATIRVYRFGYMDTNLSYGHKLPFAAVSAKKIAAKLLRDVKKGDGIYYLPKFWFWIGLVLNLIPFSIYKKIRF